MNEVKRFESTTGNIISLRTDGVCWEIVNFAADGEMVWQERSVSGDHPFTKEEARAEFERWCV